MEEANLELMAAGLRGLGLVVDEKAAVGLSAHLAAVFEWNQRFNLTRIRDEREAVLKHVIDSAMCWHVVKPWRGMRVLDLGSGAGYPGVVLKLLYPGIEMVLLEATQKKCRFLEHVRDSIVGEGLAVLCQRAEDAGQSPTYRESFDLVVARAVGELRVLAELALPLVRVGGRFLAMKGPGGAEEARAAAEGVKVLGGGAIGLERLFLPEDAGERTLVMIEKWRSTPRRFPRAAGTPERRPL